MQKSNPPITCPWCLHVWGYYEDTCHCHDGICHNRAGCSSYIREATIQEPLCGEAELSRPASATYERRGVIIKRGEPSPDSFSYTYRVMRESPPNH